MAETRDSTEERDSYNLKPPPPIRPHQLNNELEALSERFFSADHLDLILKDYALTVRFKQFLKTYRPAYIDVLKDYIEAKKAIAAIEYANAVANRLQSPATYSPLRTARLDERFETQAKQKEQTLVEEALPAYLTHRLVCLVTDTLVKEITGNSAPIMHELIPSLAEVYCISDPSVQDNPIVYASEEFYNITQYTKEFVIGRNCRFLQGPKSSDSTVARLIQALSKGEECTETILNYKRDGTPFMNLLMIAPLYDNKGAVRYFLGCQIDVSSLIENGRGVESFAQLLAQYRTEALNGSFSARKSARRDPMAILSDWGQLLTEEEAEVVKNRAQKTRSRVPSEGGMGSMTSSSKVLLNRNGSKSSRIILGMEEEPPKQEKTTNASEKKDDAKKEHAKQEDAKKPASGVKKSSKAGSVAGSVRSTRSSVKFSIREWRALQEDDFFSFDELQLLCQLIGKHGEASWLGIASAFHDKTGRRVHPDDIREKFEAIGKTCI